MAIREKIWKCADCGSDCILGRHKNCPQCGSPREKGEMKSMKGQGPTVAPVLDPELIKLAKAGPDKFCTHCSSGNRNDAERCVGCGASFYATAEEDHPDFKGDHLRHEGVDAKLKREMNRDAREDAAPALTEPPPRPPVRRTPPPPPRENTWAPVMDAEPPRPWGLIAAGVAGVVLLLGFFIWAMQTHEVQGSVTSMVWERTVHLETWTTTSTRLFRKDTTERREVQPVNGSGESAGLTLRESTCKDEYYKTIKVECGSHQDCTDIYRTEEESFTCMKPGPQVADGETCHDLGNGFEDCTPKYRAGPDVSDTCKRPIQVFDHKDCKTVIDYCDQQVNESKCDYATQVWASAGDYGSSGTGRNLTWKTVTPDVLQRATFSSATRRTLTYEDGGAERAVFPTSASRTSRGAAEASEQAYLTWDVGDKVVLSVTNLGTVSGEPRRAP